MIIARRKTKNVKNERGEFSMKKLTNKILSSILTLSMIFSLAVPTYATENFNDETDSIITEEIIEDAREVYNS